MGNKRDNDGRKIDHKTLEGIRIRVARQVVDGGKGVANVAEAIGMAESTVYSWAKKYREGGAEALAAKPIPGRPRKSS
jgi:transposase